VNEKAYRVLLVEDDPQNLYLIEFLLREAGFDVVVARDGEEALDMIVSTRPDLVITDISMPKLDGYELARRIKDSPETGSIPVIAVTAYSMKGDSEKIMQVGCDGYIPKPIDADTFVETVRRYLPPEEG
jgi:two-component system cell cycle response regulator DivK